MQISQSDVGNKSHLGCSRKYGSRGGTHNLGRLLGTVGPLYD
jgi:hypothetical protein